MNSSFLLVALVCLLASATGLEKIKNSNVKKHSSRSSHRHVRAVNHLSTIEHNKAKARQRAILAKEKAYGIVDNSEDLPIQLKFYEGFVLLSWHSMDELLATADLIEGSDAPNDAFRPTATSDNGLYDHVLGVYIDQKFDLDVARIKALWLHGAAKFFLDNYQGDFIVDYQLGRIRNAMCQVFATDPWNIINYMLHPTVDPTGDSMGVPLLRALLKIDKDREGDSSIRYFDRTTACIDAILAALLEPLATLGADPSLPLIEVQYARASAQTGYFFGCLSAAYFLNLGDQQKMLEGEKQLFGGLVDTAIGLIPMPSGPVGAVASFAAKKILSNVVQAPFDEAKRDAYEAAMGASKSLQSSIRSMVSADTDRGLVIMRWILVEYLDVKDASRDNQDP